MCIVRLCVSFNDKTVVTRCFSKKIYWSNIFALQFSVLQEKTYSGSGSTSPRFLCRPTAFFLTCWNRGTSESSTYGKQRICRCNSASTHFHVSWLSDFIFYPNLLYKLLHQSFFYSFITISPSESGVKLDYSTIFP